MGQGPHQTPPLPPNIPLPAPHPKEHRVKKSRKRVALDEQKQPKLTGWLVEQNKQGIQEQKVMAL